jgi:WD40 repeat protein
MSPRCAGSRNSLSLPGGSSFASADGTVKLWEAPSGRLPASPEGHTSGVWAVTLSADGRLAAGGSWDGTVKLWDTGSGRLLASLRGDGSTVRGVSLSRDGRLLASGGYGGTVRLWETSSGALLRALRAERRYERLDITGLTGVAPAQRSTLLALGAVDRAEAGPGR